MDILAALPDTHAGRHTEWLWSRMLAMADGSPPPDPGELAEHFAPSVFDRVAAGQLVAHLARLAPAMPLVTRLLEESSSGRRYSALLGLPDSWLRYTCAADDAEPHLLVEAAYSPALDPDGYADRRVRREGRDVRIRDFGGVGPPVLVWHGAGGDRTNWEALVPLLAGVRVVAQDLPGHGGSPSDAFTMADALADADAVVADLGASLVIVGHSLGGYLALRYAATRGGCSGWVGLDGPFGLAYPWDADDAGLPETARQVGREIRAVDVAGDLAATNGPALLLLCAVAAGPVEERIAPGRRELAEHVARHHPAIRVGWVRTGHDAILSDRLAETAGMIRGFLAGAGL